MNAMSMSAKEFKDFVNKRFKKAQIRLPKLHGPNKTEAEYREHLAREFPIGHSVFYECITLKLPSGTNYTPDWTVWSIDRIVLVVECKGAHIHSAASLRAFKEARAAFPWLRFRFAQKTATGWATKGA